MENISHKSGNYIFIVIIVILVLTIIYISVVNEKNKRIYPSNLLVKCSTNLPTLQAMNHSEMLSTLNQYHDDYVFCAATHNALVNAITEQQ